MTLFLSVVTFNRWKNKPTKSENWFFFPRFRWSCVSAPMTAFDSRLRRMFWNFRSGSNVPDVSSSPRQTRSRRRRRLGGDENAGVDRDEVRSQSPRGREEFAASPRKNKRFQAASFVFSTVPVSRRCRSWSRMNVSVGCRIQPSHLFSL